MDFEGIYYHGFLRIFHFLLTVRICTKIKDIFVKDNRNKTHECFAKTPRIYKPWI